MLINTSKLGEKNQGRQKPENRADLARKTAHHRRVQQPTAVRRFLGRGDYEQIGGKNYSLSADQYFDVKIDYVNIAPEQFAEKMETFNDNLDSLFNQLRDLKVEIRK